jgi:hypothetical protein
MPFRLLLDPARAVRSRRAREAGATSLVALFVALVLGGLSIALVHEGFAARAAVLRQETSFQAVELAEVALSKAEVEVRSQVDGGTDGIGTVTGSAGNGTFEATTVPDPVSADRFVVRTKGTQAMSVRRIEAGVRRRSRAMFVEGLFSKDGLVLDGNQRTDSYDSRLGSYASQAVNVDDGGPYSDLGGSVGSNEDIRVNGSANYIRGNAIPGPQHDVVQSGDPVITGDTVPREQEIEISDTPLAEFTAAAASNANGTWLVESGSVAYDAGRATLRVNAKSEVVLPGGTYFFSDLTLRSQAVLRVTGASRIYATGGVDLSGGTVVNETGRPADLLVFVHPYPLPATYDPPRTELTVSGHPRTAMAVYAPEADVTISGGSELFGAIVAREITLNGDTFFHYDRALGELGRAPGATFERLYWRELSPPPR